MSVSVCESIKPSVPLASIVCAGAAVASYYAGERSEDPRTKGQLDTLTYTAGTAALAGFAYMGKKGIEATVSITKHIYQKVKEQMQHVTIDGARAFVLASGLSAAGAYVAGSLGVPPEIGSAIGAGTGVLLSGKSAQPVPTATVPVGGSGVVVRTIPSGTYAATPSAAPVPISSYQHAAPVPISSYQRVTPASLRSF